jgi:very-short-patch-repair endonuclease
MANAIARKLRKTMTPHEVVLWAHLRKLKSQGHHFRRQVPLAGYVVDFACFGSKLVIEIDGGQHNDDAQARKDAERDRRLRSGGFRVLRFWNSEIDGNLDGVVATIVGAVKA